MKKCKLMLGNEAITEGAIAAGARFYAGYPITPSSEIAESAAARLPMVGGMYIQMEDEIGSMAALIGAVCSGKKAFTATSGPGISLMAENLGVAIISEIPCVIVDVQRSGPSTGMATKPAQGDIMQARWGTHGDHSIIAISPSSVQDCFDLMITAFNLSERFRTPVFFLADAIIGHLRERCVIPDEKDIYVFNRIEPTCKKEDYKPFNFSGEPAALASYGGEYVFKINGSMHDECGQPCSTPNNADRVIRHLSSKIDNNKDKICITRRYYLDDADQIIITYGGTTRSALGAMEIGRSHGIKIGVLQLVTIWPLPDKEITWVFEKADSVFVPELNLGQLLSQIQPFNKHCIPIKGINRVDGNPIEPAEILECIQEVTDNASRLS